VTTASDDPRQRQKAVLDALIKACRQCDRPDRLNVPGVTESAPGYGSVYSPAAIVGVALCRAYMEKQEPFYAAAGASSTAVTSEPVSTRPTCSPRTRSTATRLMIEIPT
jgi:hypothetical protein